MQRIALLIVIGWIQLGGWSASPSTPFPAVVAGAEFVWSGWLGPNRDGWVDQFQLPAEWPESLQLLWKTDVGTGYGSPLVSGGFVYLHARQGEDEVLWCLDLKTGSVRWRQSYSVPFQMGGGGERHGKGPKSSPAIASGRVFTLSITGLLSAWNAESGELIWRRDYGPRFKKSHPHWGTSTSPLVADDRVFVHFGTDGRGVLVALDAATGDELWSLGKDAPSYSSPILVELHGVRQIIEWNQRVLVGIAADTGRALWEFPSPQLATDQNMPTPVHCNGMILLGGENRGIHGLQPQLNDGVWSVRELWHQEEVALDMSTAVVNGDLLYGFSHYGSGRIFCLDIETGEIQWQGPGRTGENATFLAIPGYILALIDNGNLKVIAARGDSFDEVASYRVADDSTWAPAVLLPRSILVKDRQSLARWSFHEPTEIAPARSR